MSTTTSARTKRRAKPTHVPSGRNGSDPATEHANTRGRSRGRSTNGTQPTSVAPEPRMGASAASETLTELIDAALAESREADPHAIARKLEPKLTPEMRAELVFSGLIDRVTLHERKRREGGIAAPRVAGPSKWSVGLRVCVGMEWKLLANCDLSDLEALAAQHHEIAAKNLTRAQEYENLAERLRAAGCATVGEMWAQEGLAT